MGLHWDLLSLQDPNDPHKSSNTSISSASQPKVSVRVRVRVRVRIRKWVRACVRARMRVTLALTRRT